MIDDMPSKKRSFAAMAGDEEPGDSHEDRTPITSAPRLSSPEASLDDDNEAGHSLNIPSHQTEPPSHAIRSADARLHAEEDADDLDRSYDGDDEDDEDDGAPGLEDDGKAAPAAEEGEETEGMGIDEADAESGDASIADGEKNDIPAPAATGEEEKEEDMKMKEEEEYTDYPMARGTSMHDNDLFEEHWVPEIRPASASASAADDHDEESGEESEGVSEGEEESDSEESEEEEDEEDGSAEDRAAAQFGEMLFMHAAMVGMRERGEDEDEEDEE